MDDFIRPQQTTPQQRPQTNYQEHSPPPSPEPIIDLPEPKKGGKFKKFLKVLFILILIGGIGYGGYMYKQELDKNKELQSQVNSLESDLSSQSNSNAQPEQQSQQTIFTSDGGKYTVTLANQFQILEKAGSDQATLVEFVQTTDQESVLVPTAAGQQTTLATSQLGNKKFQSQVDARAKELDAKKTSQTFTFGDQKALVYDSKKAGESKTIFFSKNGIFYELQVVNVEKGADEVISTVAKGFKFN